MARPTDGARRRSSHSASPARYSSEYSLLVERRAVEPVLPLHLFKIRTFSVASIVGFIVGFAMFGAITYLPVFFQVVRGESPTVSGLQLLPLIVGMLTVSIGSGQFISRTGRYRMFPIAGTALITVGLLMLSQLGIDTDMANGGALHAGARHGTRRRDASPGTHRAKRRPLLRARRRHLRGHFLPLHRRILRRGNLRCHLRQRPRRQPRQTSRHRQTATRPVQLERHARHPGQTPRRGPSRPRRRLRRIDPDRVPHRRADRLHRLPRLMAHPRTRITPIRRYDRWRPGQHPNRNKSRRTRDARPSNPDDPRGAPRSNPPGSALTRVSGRPPKTRGPLHQKLPGCLPTIDHKRLQPRIMQVRLR